MHLLGHNKSLTLVQFPPLSLAVVKVLPSFSGVIHSKPNYRLLRGKKYLEQIQNRSTAGICLGLGRLPSI